MQGGLAVAVNLPVANQLVVMPFFANECENVLCGIAEEEPDLVRKFCALNDTLAQDAQGFIKGGFLIRRFGVSLLDEEFLYSGLLEIMQHHILAVNKKIYPLFFAVKIFNGNAQGGKLFFISVDFLAIVCQAVDRKGKQICLLSAQKGGGGKI